MAFVRYKYSNPEQVVKNNILLWLSGKQGCLAWPNDSVGIYDPIKKMYRKKTSKFHRNGVGDILVVWYGASICIETKSDVGVQSQNQKRFQIDFTRAGGIYILARCLEDVMNHPKIKDLELLQRSP